MSRFRNPSRCAPSKNKMGNWWIELPLVSMKRVRCSNDWDGYPWSKRPSAFEGISTNGIQ